MAMLRVIQVPSHLTRKEIKSIVTFLEIQPNVAASEWKASKKKRMALKRTLKKTTCYANSKRELERVQLTDVDSDSEEQQHPMIKAKDYLRDSSQESSWKPTDASTSTTTGKALETQDPPLIFTSTSYTSKPIPENFINGLRMARSKEDQTHYLRLLTQFICPQEDSVDASQKAAPICSTQGDSSVETNSKSDSKSQKPEDQETCGSSSEKGVQTEIDCAPPSSSICTTALSGLLSSLRRMTHLMKRCTKLMQVSLAVNSAAYFVKFMKSCKYAIKWTWTPLRSSLQSVAKPVLGIFGMSKFAPLFNINTSICIATPRFAALQPLQEAALACERSMEKPGFRSLIMWYSPTVEQAVGDKVCRAMRNLHLDLRAGWMPDGRAAVQKLARSLRQEVLPNFLYLGIALGSILMALYISKVSVPCVKKALNTTQEDLKQDLIKKLVPEMKINSLGTLRLPSTRLVMRDQVTRRIKEICPDLDPEVRFQVVVEVLKQSFPPSTEELEMMETFKEQAPAIWSVTSVSKRGWYHLWDWIAGRVLPVK